MSSLQEIRSEIVRLTDTVESQVQTLVNDCVNATILEIAHPAWAYPAGQEVHHNWSWLKRKPYTLTTVASTEDYVLPRYIGDIYLVRHIDPDRVLERWADSKFYKYEPYPESTGNPSIYRLWSIEGVSTRLAAADTINIVSSDTDDSGDVDLTVTIWGYSNGTIVSESLQLNGTTTVTGSITFDAAEIYVAKSKDSEGDITLTEASGATTIATIGRHERNPVFKVISFYDIPSGAKTVYIHYYTHPKILHLDGESPPFDEKWHYVVRLGTLAKVYQFLNKEESFRQAQSMYAASVRSMVLADKDEPDYVSRMARHNPFLRSPLIRRSEADVA